MKKTPFVTLEKVQEIAEEYPTPFHLYDEKGIRENAQALKEAFAWNKGFKEFFAVKATPNPFLIKILQEYGCGCDCSSMTELMLSKAIGCKKGDIMFSSNDTPDKEFKYADEIGGIINLDDITHIESVEKAVGKIPEIISCRYNPGGVFKISYDIMDNPGDAKYGMTTEQIFDAFRILKSMGAKEFGIHATSGFFFTFMAVGMAISRIFSGRIVDRGKIPQVISAGLYIVVFSFFLLSACVYIIEWNSMACNIVFFAVALLLGIGFGIMFPAYNTLFVNLAPNSQRGTATSTYLTSWDVGIGIGMLTGGYIAEVSTFDKAYLFGACLTIVSMLYFNIKVTPHYHKNKLR